MPRFSNSLTNAASVKRAGGLVKCWLGETVFSANVSFKLTAGKIWSSGFLPNCGKTFVQPSKRKIRPLAFNS